MTIPFSPIIDEAMEKGGWQPIEAAPKDGTKILSYGPNVITGRSGEFAVIAWCARDDQWFLCDGDEAPEWLGVTHWMPLPEPPAAPSITDDGANPREAAPNTLPE